MSIYYWNEKIENKQVYNSLRTFSFLFGYLPFSLKDLRNVQKQRHQLSTEEYDVLVHQHPKKWAIGILKRTKSTFHIEGLEHLPEGPVLFVSNHEGNFDIPTLIAHIPKPFSFMSKVEVEKLPIINEWMIAMNCVFIDRTDRKSAMQSITDMVSTLKDGHSMIIFPEGRRSKGNEVQDFKSGFARIAKDSHVPIVPIAIVGTADIMEKNRNKIKAAHVEMSVMAPISVETIQSLTSKELINLTHNQISSQVRFIQEVKKNQMLKH